MDQSVLEILPRMLASLAVVIIVMWGAARLLKNRSISGMSVSGKNRPLVQVVARQGMGKHSSINIVRAGEKMLVVGVTDQNITVLTELDALDLEIAMNTTRTTDSHWTGTSAMPEKSAASGQSRTGLLTQIRELTIRRS